MYCKYCGMQADDDAVFCQACGRALRAAVPEEELAGVSESDRSAEDQAAAGQNPEPAPGMEEGSAREPAEQESGESSDSPYMTDTAEIEHSPYAGIYYENLEQNRQEAEEAPAAQPQKKSRAPVIAAVAVVAVVVVILAAAWFLTQSGSSDDTVVMTCEEQDFALTNAELSYYYWSEYYYLLSYYGDYLSYYTGLDTSVALDQQAYTDSMTWDDYFRQAALSAAEETMSFVFAAEEAGYTMSDEYQSALDSTLDSFETYAIEYGFTDEDGNADVQGYLEDSYGEGASWDTFVTYLTYNYICAAYSNDLYYGVSFTEEEVSDYYDTYADEYEAAGVDKTTLLVDIRHILIECDMDDEDAAAEALSQAEEILSQWEAEDGTEEGFAALAEEYSADTGSNTNGGLYEDVYPGEMVTNFNDWCFAEGREVGDTGIVETTYGYHIMYLSGFGDAYWYASALADLTYETYSNTYYSITGSYTFEVNEEEILIGTPTSYSAS